MKAFLMTASVAAVAALIAGCGDEPAAQPPASQPPSATPSATPPTTSAPPPGVWRDDVAPAPRAGKVSGGPCRLPATFDIAPGWTVSAPAEQPRGALNARCVVKAADGSAVIKMWVADTPGANPREAIVGFVGGETITDKPEYRDTNIGRITGTEVTLAGVERSRVRAFTVTTPRQVITVSVNATGKGGGEPGLPAYLLAKQTFVLTER
ncbi:lipoprotein [Herbihabitans rhizosphaerae]|uniref:lipoprotein n=1 Tax=Herbihabitans rhizosphaerae TaxID=1872711 RepID=UPI00102CFB69|nr:lipoprotein [Herbihabitans rhizosphaerae]